MEAEERELIEAEIHEALEWNGPFHIHRNQLLAEAKKY